MIRKPNYYDKFKCIADKCNNSCCIGWEIDIDDDTKALYESISGPFGDRLKSNILTDDDNVRFNLVNNKCPFLNSNGLCDIIIELGENSLCQICSDHPRFFNNFGNAEEIGIGICCEAACELILSEENKFALIETEKADFNNADYFFNERSKIFEILQNRNINVDERVENLIKEFNIELPDYSITELLDFYLRLDILSAEWKDILTNTAKKSGKYIQNTDELETPFEQLLVYFIYRHYASSQEDLLSKERIAFAIISYRIIKHLVLSSDAVDFKNLCNISRMYSSEIEYSEENINTLFDFLQQNY